jgi:ferritin-like metal-binding protein YciE
MEGLLEEGKEVLDADGPGGVIDAALIAAAQRVEHYEISSYGTARALCEFMGQSKAAKLLQQTLDEESAADEKLTAISVGQVMPAAGNGDGES